MAVTPHTVQSVLVVYLVYTQQFVPLHPLPLMSPPPFPLPSGNHWFVLYITESGSLLHICSLVLFFRFHVEIFPCPLHFGLIV